MSRNPYATALRFVRQQRIEDKREMTRERIVLSEASFDALLDALDNPPPPSDRLVKLMRDA